VVTLRVKVWVLSAAYMILVNSSALQSVKWQLIGMS